MVCFSAEPIFTNGNRLTQYGEFGKNVDINVYVYSIPIHKKNSGTEETYQCRHQPNMSCQTENQYLMIHSMVKMYNWMVTVLY